MAANKELARSKLPNFQKQKQRLKFSSFLVLFFCLLLLGSSIFLGTLVFEQIQTLESHSHVTENIIDANTRSLGQAQRELLRLITLLESGENDPDAINLQLAFVGQRMSEIALRYQIHTLGSEQLLAEVRQLTSQWEMEVKPIVVAISADDMDDDADLRREAIGLMSDIELTLNQLVAEGEINRKRQAGIVNDDTLRILAIARSMLVGWGSILFGFLSLVVVTSILYYRFHKQREATSKHLVELNLEMNKLSQVASSTDNMVIIADPAGKIEWVNAAFTRTTGYCLAESVGRRPGHLLQGRESSPETIAFMRERISSGNGFRCEIVNYAKNGRPYWVEIEVQPVRDEQNQIKYFIAVERDITERRETERHLRQAKEDAELAAQAKSAFLASMSHEIRTPLNAVIGLNSLLLNSELTDKQRQFATTARSSGRLLLMLVNNVLDFSALESGRVELEKRPFSLKQSIKELFDLLEHEASHKEIALHCHIDTAVPDILVGDETRMRQILLNLLGNSLKFTQTGSVDLHLTAQCEAEDVELKVMIQDTGIGIPRDRLERLFQPFTQVDASTTRKYGGTGLGLAISKMIVNMMGGELSVDSKVGVGTTFTFSIKLEKGESQSLTAPTFVTAGNKIMGEKWPLRILLVEDDTVNQQVATHMLSQFGYQTEIAVNGSKALNILQEKEYDVVFMDIHMPEMDGVNATKAIHKHLPKAKLPFIIAMTASALEGDRERFIQAGMDDYMSKPIQFESIYRALRHVIHKRGGHVDTSLLTNPEQQSKNGHAAPPIDALAFYERMGAKQEALLDKLVTIFTAEAKRKLIDLKHALEEQNHKKVRHLAHHLKGSSNGASAVKFAAIAHKLELQASQNDLSEAQHLFTQLSQELTRVTAWTETPH